MRIIQEEVAGSDNESVLLEAPNSLSSPAVQKYTPDPDGYEGEMARKSLYHMARQADQLHGMLRADENLEPWVQDKISKAADYLESAFKSITYDKDNPKGH